MTNKGEKVFTDPSLTLSLKLDILYRLLMGYKLSPLMDALTPEEMIKALQFIWEKTLEIGLHIKGSQFSRSNILDHAKVLDRFQKQKHCQESLQKCKGIDCFSEHPECAREKAKFESDALVGALQKTVLRKPG